MESRRPRSGGAPSRPPPAGPTPSAELKVKHIITRKVSTDEASFKDVVQRFTGKDSAAARAELLLRACDGRSFSTAPVVAAGGSRSSNVDGEVSVGAGFNTGTAASFQDTVLPSLEEMDRWWGSNNGIDSYGDCRP